MKLCVIKNEVFVRKYFIKTKKIQALLVIWVGMYVQPMTSNASKKTLSGSWVLNRIVSYSTMYFRDTVHSHTFANLNVLKMGLKGEVKLKVT